MSNDEQQPLLVESTSREFSGAPIVVKDHRETKTRSIIWAGLTGITTIALFFFLLFADRFADSLPAWVGIMPHNPELAAYRILDAHPIIDGHVDLPYLVRMKYANNASAVDLRKEMPGHIDIPRLRKGRVGGFFWSVYVECGNEQVEGEDFLGATWRVRDTLEQIDVSRLLIDRYPDTFQLALGSQDITAAMNKGKIASLLGVEGGHQLGNSIAVLRQYHALGVRYMTLTHTCHNAFADSCGMLPGKIPLHHGLSPLGISLIKEMNRLGVLVDLSHTSDATAIQGLQHSVAPVIWSHSSSRAVHDVPRNVPDNILAMIGTGKGQKDAVVMVNFLPFFVATPRNATIASVADHVDHIATVAGKKHVGIGSDYDGIEDTPVGLEDASKFPALIAELIRRGWTERDISGLAGGNLLRVFAGAEKVSQQLRHTSPTYDLYPQRPDLPAHQEES